MEAELQALKAEIYDATKLSEGMKAVLMDIAKQLGVTENISHEAITKAIQELKTKHDNL